MTFVPRGYIPLVTAVQQLIIKLGGEFLIRVTRDAKELSTLETKVREHDALILARAKHASAERRFPRVSPHSGSEPPPSPWGTSDMIERRLVLRRQAAALDRLTKSITYHVRQELGDGDVQAEALASIGVMLSISATSWRTDRGAAAIARGENLLSEPTYEPRLLGTPMVTEAIFAHWLERLTAMLSEYESVASTVPDRTRPVATDENATPAVVVMAHPRARSVQRRASVFQSKADEWMHAAAVHERTNQAYLSRTDGTMRCMAELNCTRNVARAAYTALPGDIKQPRGKPKAEPA